MPRVRRAKRSSDEYLDHSTLRVFGLGVLCAKLVVVPLVFDPLARVAFAVPKAAVSLALGALLVGVLVALALRFGRSLWRSTSIHWAVGAVAGAYALAAVFGLNLATSLLGAPDRALGMLSLVDNVATYFGLLLLPRSRADVTKLATCAFVPVVPIVIYEGVQRAGLDPLPWASGLARERPFSTLGNAGPLAHYLGTLASAGAAFAAHRSLSGGAAITLLAVTLAAGLGALATDARAALIGFGAAGAVGALLLSVRAERRVRRGFVASSLALAVVGTGAILLTPVGERLRQTVQVVVLGDQAGQRFAAGSTQGRLLHYRIALSQVRDRPILGVGPDNYAVAFPRYRPLGAAEVLGSNAMESSTHSWFLKIVTDSGLAGLAAVLATMALAVRTTRSAAHRSLSDAALIAGAFFLGAGLFSVSDVGTNWLYWACLAVIAGSQVKPEPAQSEKRRTSQTTAVKPRASYVAIAISVVASGWMLLELPAARADNRSQMLRSSARPAAAVGAATEAVNLKPVRAEYWHELGLARAATGAFAEAEEAFGAAVALNPFHTTYLVNLARAQVAVGLTRREALARADRTAAAAVANDPNNPDAQFARALAAHASGNLGASVEASERGLLAGLPGEPFPYEVASRAYLELGRPSDAERWARMGLQRFTTTGLRLSLAHALFVLGQSAGARTLVQAVLDVEPNNERARRLLVEFATTSP